MELANKQLSRSAQSWINRAAAERRHNYRSELRDWVRHVILEADKNRNLKKKEKFLSLLRDLNAAGV